MIRIINNCDRNTSAISKVAADGKSREMRGRGRDARVVGIELCKVLLHFTRMPVLQGGNEAAAQRAGCTRERLSDCST